MVHAGAGAGRDATGTAGDETRQDGEMVEVKWGEWLGKGEPVQGDARGMQRWNLVPLVMSWPEGDDLVRAWSRCGSKPWSGVPWLRCFSNGGHRVPGSCSTLVGM